MKARNILVYTVIMLFVSTLALQAVTLALTGRSLLQMPSAFRPKSETTVDHSFRCSDKPAIQNLDKANDSQLKKLVQYQQICNSAVTSTMMLFTDMPKDNQDALTKVDKMSKTLKEFANYQVKPLVIAEPVTTAGDISFTEFKNGLYDDWLKTYFQALKAKGISDKDMGVWVPFPEANLPYWNRSNATPQDFGIIVSKYVTIAKQFFPGMEASILLNSATYSADDFDWSKGEYSSLVPYVKAVQPGLINSFGLQGFPWMPPANKAGNGIFDASEFLNYKLAKEAADTLKVKKIWLNTGTFGIKYAGDPARQTQVDASKRTDVLNGILVQAQELRDMGFQVAINLFAEDKSDTDELTDWSYFHDDSVSTSPASPVFTNFASRMKQNNIELWLFDK